MAKITFLMCLFLTSQLFAGTVQIPKSAILTPANDLTFQGRDIDRDEAYDLFRDGINLSDLNPRESLLWEDQKFSLPPDYQSSFPVQGSIAYYKSTLFDLSSAKGLYRSSLDIEVNGESKPFTFTASLDNHGALMRALLLRKLGYKISPPKLYKELTISFDKVQINQSNYLQFEDKFLIDEENPDWYLVRLGLIKPLENEEDFEGESDNPDLTLSEKRDLVLSELNRKTLSERIHLAKLYLRDRFLDRLSDFTLTSRDRWIAEYPENDPWVKVKDIVLEKGRVQVQQLHWGLITPEMAEEKRIFRSLIIPFVLGDFKERVNTFSWEPGTIFNDHVTFEHLNYESFGRTTIDDARWIGKRIGDLTSDDFSEIVKFSEFPEDIEALLIEKMKSRRNRILFLLELERKYPNLRVNTHLTIGNVKDGKLLPKDFSQYAPDFVDEDPKSPLRFTEILRYFTLEVIGAGLSYGMDELNNLIPSWSVADLVDNNVEKIQSDIKKHINKNGPGVPYVLPTSLKFIGGPTASLRFNVGRSVVSGTYYQSSAKIQVVDQLGVSASLGAFLSYSGIDDVLPSLSAQVSLSRNYIHVKPVGSVKKALTTDWTSMLVAEFMPRLGRILKPNKECTLPKEDVWVSEVEIDGKTYHKVEYDNFASLPDVSNERKEEVKRQAAQRRITLVDEVGSDNVLLGIHEKDKKEFCFTEVDTQVNKNIKEFADRLEPGEMFVIADGLASGVEGRVVIPLTELLGLPSGAAASVSAHAGFSYSLIRRTTIYKNEDGKIQVYIQNLNRKVLEAGIDLNFYINVMSASFEYHKAKANTEFYQLPLDEGDLLGKKKEAMRALKSLLKWNRAEVLRDHFHPWRIKHKIKQKIARFSFLWRHYDFLRSEHTVNITPPFDPEGRYISNERRRQLFLYRKVNRGGNNYYGFFAKLMRWVTNEYGPGPIGPITRPGENPAYTPFGSAKWTSYSVEAETSPGVELKPMAITEQVYAGWMIRNKRLMNILDKLEADIRDYDLDRHVIKRSLFNTTSILELYEIRSTLIFYPAAMEKIKDFMIQNKRKLYWYLVDNFGDARPAGCVNWEFAAQNLQRQMHRRTFCVSPFWKEMLKLREKYHDDYRSRAGFANPKETVRWLTDVVAKLQKKVEIPKLLNWLGKENFLFLVRVAGFRRNDETGATDYVSDTVGNYDDDIGVGIFKEIAAATGIAPFEIYASYFNPGF